MYIQEAQDHGIEKQLESYEAPLVAVLKLRRRHTRCYQRETQPYFFRIYFSLSFFCSVVFLSFNTDLFGYIRPNRLQH